MRLISGDLRTAITSPSSGEVILVFATIIHADLNPSIRVVSDGQNGVSHYNGLPINYMHNGHLYAGCPFLIDLVSDDEQPPRGRFSIVDVEREVGLYFLSLTDSPRLDLELCKASDWSDAIDDDDNSRAPTATPGIIYRARHLRLNNVAGDALSVTGDIGSYDPRSEPWPKYRATQTLLPGLYRR